METWWDHFFTCCNVFGSKVSWFSWSSPTASFPGFCFSSSQTPTSGVTRRHQTIVTWKYFWFCTSSKLRDLKRPNPFLPQLLFFLACFLRLLMQMAPYLTRDCHFFIHSFASCTVNVKTNKLKWLPGMNNDHDYKKSTLKNSNDNNNIEELW